MRVLVTGATGVLGRVMVGRQAGQRTSAAPETWKQFLAERYGDGPRG